MKDSPEKISPLRRYQLRCVDRGVSPVALNAAITGLKFFFEVTPKRPELVSKLSHVRAARTLPAFLSREEASRLIESARTLKLRTALSVAYGAGLHVSEVTALKVGDIIVSTTPLEDCSTPAHPALWAWKLARTRAGVGQSLT